MKRRSFLTALFAAPFFPAASGTLRNPEQTSRDASGNKARITSEVQARADADSAFASNIGTVKAGALRSRDGRMTIDLSTGTILIMS